MMTLFKQNWDMIGLYGGTIFISICVFFAVIASAISLPWKSQDLQQAQLEFELIYSCVVGKIRAVCSRAQGVLGNLKRCLRPRSMWEKKNSGLTLKKCEVLK